MDTHSASRKFRPNCKIESESIEAFLERNRLSQEDAAWAHSQPVHGKPDLNRLRAALTKAGFADIEIQLSDRQNLSFKVGLTQMVIAEDSEALLRLWITAFRTAGFQIGFEEMAVVEVDGPIICGQALTGPLVEIAEHGALQFES